MVKIAPSVLSADFARLGEEVASVAVDEAVDRIHIDVMDGMFVPNLTIGPLVVEALRSRTRLLLEAHLMIEAPGRYVKSFVEAGADIVIVHYEACPHLHRDVQLIKELGVRAGVALNPATPVTSLTDILGDLDLVLIMTVNPGFGGQQFIASMLPKIARMRGMCEERGVKAEIEVDGGVNAQLAGQVVAAGADVLVAGSAVFKHRAGPAKAVAELVGGVGQRQRPVAL